MKVELNKNDAVRLFEPEYPEGFVSIYDFVIPEENNFLNFEIIVSGVSNAKIFVDHHNDGKFGILTGKQARSYEQNSVFNRFSLSSRLSSLRIKIGGEYFNHDCEIKIVKISKIKAQLANLEPFLLLLHNTTNIIRNLNIKNIKARRNLKLILSQIIESVKTRKINIAQRESLPHVGVDILMATYNGDKYLCEQLDSLFSQDHLDFRLIVSDDGSSDSTIEALNSYMKKHDNMIVINNTNNEGYIKNFERLMYLSNADYVFFCDQDDVWKSNKISTTLKAFNQGNHALIYSDLVVVDENNQHIHDSFWDMMDLNIESGNSQEVFRKNFITGCTVAVLGEVLNLSLPLSPNLPHDHQISKLASQYKDGLLAIPEALINYRQHQSNEIGAYTDYLEIFYLVSGQWKRKRTKFIFDKKLKSNQVSLSFDAEFQASRFRIDPTARLSKVSSLNVKLNDVDITNIGVFKNVNIQKDSYYTLNQDMNIILNFPINIGDKVMIEFDIEYAWEVIV